MHSKLLRKTSIVFILLFLFVVRAVATDNDKCGELHVPTIELSDGFCNELVLKSKVLSALVASIADDRVEPTSTSIDWTATTRNTDREVQTFNLSYKLYDKVGLDFATCETSVRVVDVSTPQCPTSARSVLVPIGNDCKVLGPEAILKFNEMEVLGKPHCTGGQLYADISAYVKDGRTVGITEEKIYPANWNKYAATDRVVYRLASNAMFKNYTECDAYVYVYDDSELECPELGNIILESDELGNLNLTSADLPKPLSCNPQIVNSRYFIRKENDTEFSELDVDNLSAVHLDFGNYEFKSEFERVAGDYVGAKQKTCSQTLVVKDATKPKCPTKKTISETNCSLDVDDVYNRIKSVVMESSKLDNVTANGDLLIKNVSGDNYIESAAAPTPHNYSYRLYDVAGNYAECQLSITLEDKEAPICPTNEPVEVLITENGVCSADTVVKLSGTDNCAISKINWIVNNKAKPYLASEADIPINNLSIGEHDITWQLVDKVGLMSELCHQSVQVFSAHDVQVSCEEPSDYLITEGDLSLDDVVALLPIPSATAYNCNKGIFETVSLSSLLLGTEDLTSGNLKEKILGEGCYTLTRKYKLAASAFRKETEGVCVQYFTIAPKKTSEFSATGCDSFVWNGKTYTESRDYQQTFKTKLGGDSIVTAHLTINKSTSTEFSAVACDAYVWNGQTYTESGDYTQTLQTKAGCDSVVTVHLTINKSTSTEFTAVACDAYVWNGQTYTESGDYTQTLQTKSGCDSVVTLHLTIGETYYTSNNVKVSDVYEWYGVAYTESGTYFREMKTENGCDSIEELHLVITRNYTDTIRVEACDAYVWNSKVYETSGTYSHSFATSDGDDSTEVLVLNVHHPVEPVVYVYSCGSLTWRGETYTENTVLVDSLYTEFGCDSVVHYQLVINETARIDTVAEACNDFFWHGKMYTESGVFRDTLKTFFGCDSILTLSLTVHKDVKVIEQRIACDSFSWNGDCFRKSGTYEKHFVSQYGCDSLAVLELTIIHSSFHSLAALSCGPYEWNGKVYETSGVYRDTLISSMGCDSILELDLHVGLPVDTVYTDSVLQGNGYHKYGFVIAAEAIATLGEHKFQHTRTTVCGCDSTVTLLLMVHRGPAIEVEDSSVVIEAVRPDVEDGRIDSYCVGDTVRVLFHVSSGNAGRYTLKFGDAALRCGFQNVSGSLSDGLPMFVIPASAETGTYEVCLTLSNDLRESTPVSIHFSVGLPSKLIVRMWNDVVVFNNRDLDYVAYQWKKSGVDITGATNQYYQDLETVAGLYGLTVWRENGDRLEVCPRRFDRLEVPFALLVSPNPTRVNESCEILLKGVDEDMLKRSCLLVYNASGMLECSIKNVQERNVFIPASSGTYVVLLSVDGGNVANSIVLVKP